MQTRLLLQLTRKVRLADILPVVSRDRKSTRLNSSHLVISYAVFCLKKKKKVIANNASIVLKFPHYVMETLLIMNSEVESCYVTIVCIVLLRYMLLSDIVRIFDRSA